MSSSRTERISKRRLSLLAGAAALTCAGAPAMAQTAPATAKGAPFNIEAQTVTRDDKGVITAEGQVEGRYEDRTLRAKRVSVDPNSEIISANGGVLIVDDRGDVEYADSIMLNRDMTSGVATGFAARQKMKEGTEAKFAAATAIRYDENLTEMVRAIYTPCDICNEDGAAKRPTWSVSADEIVQDRDNKVVYFRNATVRVKGVPLFWTPVFWEADPQADRASGFLAPRFSQNRRRGLSYEQPFLWSISPYQDLVVTPQINTRVNPFIDAEWRKRFYSGQIDARFGYTHERDFNTRGVEFGPDRNKGYVLANGEFKPLRDWTFGFTAERAQDKLVFDQYSIADIYRDRGLFLSDDRRLLSQAYAVRQGQRSYLSVTALSFQSLRPNLALAPNSFGIRPFEDDDTLPVVGPLVEGRYEPDTRILGGRLRLQGGGVVLNRKESPSTPGAKGVDSSRATLEGDWRTFVTTSSGVRIEPFVNVRGDYYRVSDVVADTQTTSRGLATAGVDISWPFIKTMGRTTVVLEPIAQLALSADAKTYPKVPNEDSVAFDFNDTNLFEANKSPGFDLFEGGQRLNVGVRASADWGDGRNAQMVIGRSFRADPDPNFAPRTGIHGRTSDWIFAAEATPVRGLSFYTKSRLDDATLEIRRAEFGIDATTARASGHVRYLREDIDFAGVPREDVEAAGDIFLTRRWGVTFDAVHDLEQSVWRRRSLGVVYKDECTRFAVIYQRHDRPVLGGRSSGSISVQLSLTP